MSHFRYLQLLLHLSEKKKHNHHRAWYPFHSYKSSVTTTSQQTHGDNLESWLASIPLQRDPVGISSRWYFESLKIRAGTNSAQIAVQQPSGVWYCWAPQSSSSVSVLGQKADITIMMVGFKLTHQDCLEQIKRQSIDIRVLYSPEVIRFRKCSQHEHEDFCSGDSMGFHESFQSSQKSRDKLPTIIHKKKLNVSTYVPKFDPEIFTSHGRWSVGNAYTLRGLQNARAQGRLRCDRVRWDREVVLKASPRSSQNFSFRGKLWSKFTRYIDIFHTSSYTYLKKLSFFVYYSGLKNGCFFENIFQKVPKLWSIFRTLKQSKQIDELTHTSFGKNYNITCQHALWDSVEVFLICCSCGPSKKPPWKSPTRPGHQVPLDDPNATCRRPERKMGCSPWWTEHGWLQWARLTNDVGKRVKIYLQQIVKVDLFVF